MNQEKLLEGIMALLQARSEVEAMQALKENPELLNSDADIMLQQLISTMTSFYRLWRVKGMPPVQALSKAQEELRGQERFRHPFYWAAFYMTGV